MNNKDEEEFYKRCKVEYLNSVEDLAKLTIKYSGNYNWIFRGQSGIGWGLKSSLERAFDDFEIKEDKARLEGGLVRRFKRQCAHYLKSIPTNNLEIMSLMQHYGAPTRLLDVTYSFPVAVFFALDKTEKSGSCEIFALDKNAVNKNLKARVGPENYEILEKSQRNLEDTKVFREIFLSEEPFVAAVNPYFLNERLTIQQGAFLCQGDINVPFRENLFGKSSKDNWNEEDIIVYRINCQEKGGTLTENLESENKDEPKGEKEGKATKQDILRWLHRVNLSHSTLYPGLEGFSNSLRNLLAFPEFLEPDYDWLGVKNS